METKIHNKYKDLYPKEIREETVHLIKPNGHTDYVALPLVMPEDNQVTFGGLSSPLGGLKFISVELEHTNYGISRNSPLGKVLNGHSE